ncbi:MAG: hypothetical protein HYZ13_14565 [Acidobacteria bacterium]|nr:hypothetical protein [Acidobacteriota bacterium]
MNFIYDTLGAALAIAIFGVAIWITWILRRWLYRPEVGVWVASYWWAATGIGLYLVHAPTESGDLYLTALRNSLLMVSAGLQWVGCLRFGGRSVPSALALIPALLYLAILAPLSAHLQGRPLAFSAALVPFLLHGAWALNRNLSIPIARTGHFVVATLGVHGAFHGFRAVMLVSSWERADLFLWISVGFLEAFPVLITLAVAQWMLIEHRMEALDLPSSR